MAKKAKNNPPVHTVPYGDQWANISESSNRHFGVADRKADAERTGRDSAERRGTEHLSHRKDGTIGERRSYGNDPHPPEG